MSKDTLDIILVFVLLFAVVFIFIRIALKVRRGGGSMTTLMHGASDGFYNKDKKKAIEYTTEQKAGKKMSEQSSGEDINRNKD
jgi:hypothetical protein